MSTPQTNHIGFTSSSDIQNYFDSKISETKEELINYISNFLGPQHYDDAEIGTASLQITLEHMQRREFRFRPGNPLSNEKILKLDHHNERMRILHLQWEDLAAMFDREMDCFNGSTPGAGQLDRSEFHSHNDVREYYRSRIEDLKEELSNMEDLNRREWGKGMWGKWMAPIIKLRDLMAERERERELGARKEWVYSEFDYDDSDQENVEGDEDFDSDDSIHGMVEEEEDYYVG
jgi:hypothetical protein